MALGPLLGSGVILGAAFGAFGAVGAVGVFGALVRWEKWKLCQVCGRGVISHRSGCSGCVAARGSARPQWLR